MTPATTSQESTSARALVSPYEYHRGSKRNNPQHKGLMMQMMLMSMLQHNQYMEEEHQCCGKECEDCLAMQ
jgi:hypothetical protein